MAEPFIFIGTHTVKAGKFQEFEKFFAEFCESVVEANEPRLLSFHGYANGAENEVTVVQVHPDAESMVTHMGFITEHVSRAYAELLDGSTSRIQVYGNPRGGVVEMIESMIQQGAQVEVKAPFTGFNRLPDL